MTTELKRFTDAYATMTFAVYEPLIVRWYSQLGVGSIASAYVQRAVSGEMIKRQEAIIAAPATISLGAEAIKSARLRAPYLHAGIPGIEENALFKRWPGLEIEAGVMIPGGRYDEAAGKLPEGAAARKEAPPLIFGAGTGRATGGLDTALITKDLIGSYINKIKELVQDFRGTIPGSELKKWLFDLAKQRIVSHGGILQGGLLQPADDWQEYLSPIGVAHFYRQLYFYVSEGVGPIEQAFTVAPSETLEIVTETVRRQSHEEIYEHGSETVSEVAIESRNTDEVSDKVASMVERDSSLGLSANTNFSASGSVGVFNFGGGASMGVNTNMSSSSQSSSELARRRLKEMTKRAAERITKTFSVRVRDTTDYTTTNLQRRVIKNETNGPVNYGLRRVFSRIRVKVQDLGPRLVWQLYVSNPGTGLARSRFVHFMDSQPIAEPSEPPAIRPKPTGGIDTGTTAVQIKLDTNTQMNDPMHWYVTLSIPVPPDRKIVAVSIESITDLENTGKDDYAPSATGGSKPGTLNGSIYTVDLGVYPGNSESVSLSYQYRYDPSDSAMQQYQEEYDAAMTEFRKAEAAVREKALREQFERKKQLLTEKSRIRARASADLRKEERYEILNRMISHLFRPRGNGSPGAPAPIEIEYFHRYFDLDALFFYVHPSWWVPRYAGELTGFGRPEYEITAESELARMGHSLGWVIQLDGDDRRNEFINSPWLRVCLPMRPGRERDAVAWLAEHVEGDIGYDLTIDPLKGLLGDIERVRTNEKKVAASGPDYVDADTAIVAASGGAPVGPLKPENVYPVIDHFEVTVPTEGFVYDDLQVKIP